jgi:hypothetical protein
MTTDTVPKTASAVIGSGPARVVGVAKGVGMIEPDMATLITLLFTDADVEPDDLDAVFRRVIDRTFNCVSVDTDTSTSDTAIVLSSGAAGPVDLSDLEDALHSVALSLTKTVSSPLTTATGRKTCPASLTVTSSLTVGSITSPNRNVSLVSVTVIVSAPVTSRSVLIVSSPRLLALNVRPPALASSIWRLFRTSGEVPV